MWKPSIGIVALVVPAWSWSPVVTPPQGSAPLPNIVLIVLDDVGVETIRSYGPSVPTPPTPTLSWLAANGVRFTRTYAYPLCSPTRATILTGRHAFRTGMSSLSAAPEAPTYSLPLGELTIPELLADAAEPYASGAFGKWHLGALDDLTHPIRQGFDVFAGTTGSETNHFSWDLVRADRDGADAVHVGSALGPFDETTYSASVIRSAASQWIASASEPFFAYVCFSPPHSPWQVPPSSLLSNPPNSSTFPAGSIHSTPTARRLAYRWMLESVDTEIRRLLTSVPAAKRPRTMVLIVSDNGTPGSVIDTTSTAAVGPPPTFSPLVYDPAHAKGSVHEQGTRVPMIACGYGVHSGGLACTGLVSTVDVWRTVLDLARVPAPSLLEFDGVSFAHMLANPAAASLRTAAFVQLYSPNAPYDPREFDDDCGDFMFWMTGHRRAITDGRFKYIRQYNAPYQQAFDLSIDPLETQNIWPWSQSACAVTPTTPTQSAIWALRNQMVQLSGM